MIPKSVFLTTHNCSHPYSYCSNSDLHLPFLWSYYIVFLLVLCLSFWLFPPSSSKWWHKINLLKAVPSICHLITKKSLMAPYCLQDNPNSLMWQSKFLPTYPTMFSHMPNLFRILSFGSLHWEDIWNALFLLPLPLPAHPHLEGRGGEGMGGEVREEDRLKTKRLSLSNKTKQNKKTFNAKILNSKPLISLHFHTEDGRMTKQLCLQSALFYRLFSVMIPEHTLPSHILCVNKFYVACNQNATINIL